MFACIKMGVDGTATSKKNTVSVSTQNQNELQSGKIGKIFLRSKIKYIYLFGN